MNLQDVHRHLLTYNEIELSNKQKYLKSKGNTAYNYAWDYPVVAPSVRQQDNRLFFILTGLTDVFPEDRYFKANYDVTLLKHDRYAYPFVHKHHFFEMLYVYSGSFVHKVEGEKQTVYEGQIVIIPPGVQHALEVYDDSVVINLLIKSSSFDQAFRSLLGRSNVLSEFFTNCIYSKEKKGILSLDTENDPVLKNYLLQMFQEEYEEKDYTDVILNHMLMIFFCQLLRNHEYTAVYHHLHICDDKAMQILQCIKDNFATITLDDLAQQFFFNKYYLSRLIKSKTGSNFSDIIRKTRLDVAVQLVGNTNLSLLEISNAVGYSDPTNLIKAFKKEYGVSPKEYRKKQQSRPN